MSAWLSIIGLGEDGLSGLSPVARALIDGAELIVGGERHLALIGTTRAERRTWETPLSATVAAIAAWRGRAVVVLATGDPMWYGVGVTLARRFPPPESLILPQAGAFSLAAARLGWPLAEVETLTVHGRSLDLLALHFHPGARLIILSEDGTTPAKVAALLAARGWGRSHMTVFAHMGGPTETRQDGVAAQWGDRAAADLNTIAVVCEAESGATIIARTGLPDDVFEHDGQITKREVRAVTLAALVPLPGQRLWDVGAGSGAVAIEWMRAARGTHAIAIERDGSRAQRIARNAAALGVPALRIVAGAAPAALDDLATPDAVFIGGGVADPAIIARCWSVLHAGGRLVANAVTIEGEAALIAAHRQFGGVLVRLQVARAEPVGGLLGWRPLMPVTQWQATRP
ncbi:MAG: precorrin-6y C5,15-methyltransferase (decarboxylating) subunit CbiE [Alphaproteobacteria bacterium]|nr:precorrin-6y C5,15-methyltransferase (decarboxylating) subunit CbiE [Alphaproteobacteria bacterium]